MVYSFLFIVSLLVPYPSVQHFIWPLHWCLLADICNHTYIPECGTENEDDIYNRRLFIDECDLFEYNCDFETDFYPINYSSCYNLPPRPCPVIPCPSIPTCPDHRFHINGPIFTVEPTKKYPKLTTTTPPPLSSPKISSTTSKYTKKSTTPTLSSPPNNYGTSTVHLNSTHTTSTTPKNLRLYQIIFTSSKYPKKPTTSGSPYPRYMLVGKRRYLTFKKKKRKTKRQLTARNTARKPIKKTPRTTTRTKILKKITVKKNGRVFIKVFKAIIKKNPPEKKNHDSDFLE